MPAIPWALMRWAEPWTSSENCQQENMYEAPPFTGGHCGSLLLPIRSEVFPGPSWPNFPVTWIRSRKVDLRPSIESARRSRFLCGKTRLPPQRSTSGAEVSSGRVWGFGESRPVGQNVSGTRPYLRPLQVRRGCGFKIPVDLPLSAMRGGPALFRPLLRSTTHFPCRPAVGRPVAWRFSESRGRRTPPCSPVRSRTSWRGFRPSLTSRV